MNARLISRKEFLAVFGAAGAGTCLCAAAAGMGAALADERPDANNPGAAGGQSPVQAKPGDQSVERAVKRMEFGDAWVRRFFEVMDQSLDETARRRLMMANGKACFAAYAGPPKKEPGQDAVEKFLQWVGTKGKERGYSAEGKIVSFEFVGSAETGQAAPERICLCPMAEAQTPGKISPTYCLCSLGYVKEMHERMLGRPVEVELVDSVLRGGKRCTFRMTIA
jgi:hypothetical protein